METRQILHRYARSCVAFACASLCGWFPALSVADGARTGQNAQPGEIVVMRNVATRPADRAPTAPGMALLVSTSPNNLLNQPLPGSHGADDVSDADIAALNGGPAAGGVSVTNGLQHSLGPKLGADIGGRLAATSGHGASTVLGTQTAGGPIADSTRNIGSQVTNALSQIPLLGANH
jgi:hypothetical protein